ncbi:hypothetical protein ABMA70_02785 [Halobacteriovorax sp. XZX-3]|uniref:hypothetical protein n=1 Tax=unclassified Halobacteriovorax TaxID=2639665 RepID=UPI000CD23E21|nr:hypothetical protein [Halobacteriovorax sp. DA5]POB14665.1 hypothetical protein C0Z22_06100 [Halobacteriovorax sp. DA5]
MIRQLAVLPGVIVGTGRRVKRIYRSELRCINELDELQEFQQLAYQRIGVKFPLDFLARNKTFALFNKHGLMCGGFTFALGSDSRVVKSLPDDALAKLKKDVPDFENDLFEATALWMSRYQRCRLLGVYFWLMMYIEASRMGRNFYIYAYSSAKPKLGEIYNTIRPFRLYKGYTKMLPGMSEPDDEVIEYGTMMNVHLSFGRIVMFLLKRLLKARSIKKVKSYS